MQDGDSVHTVIVDGPQELVPSLCAAIHPGADLCGFAPVAQIPLLVECLASAVLNSSIEV